VQCQYIELANIANHSSYIDTHQLHDVLKQSEQSVNNTSKPLITWNLEDTSRTSTNARHFTVS